jgi:PAS domain S-box-containing protein
MMELLANSGDDVAFIFLDLDGRVTHFTRGAEAIFGRTAAETVGHDSGELFVPEDLDYGMDRMEREVAARDESSEDDRWQRRGDGTRFWASGAMVGLVENGKRIGFGKVLRNRTDLKAQVEALRKGVEDLQAEAQSRDVFLSTLSHELRNPLTPVANAVNLLRSAQPGTREHGFALGVIDRQMAMLQRLVDDLLDLTRVGAGKVELRMGTSPLQKVVEAAVESARPLMDERRHALQVIAPETPIPVRCDFERMAQVLVNLLNNAAKYTPPGGHVWVTLMIEGDEAVTRVEDDGVGIPHEMLPRIFDLFTQVESSRHASRGGLGIGLALVKRSDGLGKGSVFSVRLPLADDRASGSP